MIDFFTPTISFFGLIALIVFFESKKRPKCAHLRTRCIHGDEITHRMKVYPFLWWKSEVIRRQACLYCGAALDRSAVCTATGEELHDWEGTWPYEKKEN